MLIVTLSKIFGLSATGAVSGFGALYGFTGGFFISKGIDFSPAVFLGLLAPALDLPFILTWIFSPAANSGTLNSPRLFASLDSDFS